LTTYAADFCRTSVLFFLRQRKTSKTSNPVALKIGHLAKKGNSGKYSHQSSKLHATCFNSKMLPLMVTKIHPKKATWEDVVTLDAPLGIMGDLKTGYTHPNPNLC